MAHVLSLLLYLVFVGGIEGDLGHFGVLAPHVTDTPTAQLDALQQSGLRCVPSCLPLVKTHTLAQSLTCEYGDMSIVCLTAFVCHAVSLCLIPGS